jgi:hypothetical protein
MMRDLVIYKEETKVKTLKISINYSSNHYAFVIFQNVNFKDREEEIKSIENYLQENFQDLNIYAERYEPKDKN